jgi:hypothetical protein
MSSSVSSERAFSSAGITISKRRNRLKSDIVEALQVLKCMMKRNLIFRKSALVDDDGTDDFDLSNDSGGNFTVKKPSGIGSELSWDSILAEDLDNYDPDYDISI